MYTDRKDAGQALARSLESYRDSDCLVLALPRGGVVVGFEIARELHAPLEVLVVRKLGAPMQPEFGFGAIGPGGALILDERSVRMLGLSQEDIRRVIDHEQGEMQRRQEAYQGNRPRPSLRDRTVILTDDGLATGVTARVAIQAVRDAGAAAVVLAVPVAPAGADVEFGGIVDEFVCPQMPSHFQAIGQFYEQFDQTRDEEVIDLLERARRDGGQAARRAG
jgi:putative phosphoribosyl transferase